MKLFDLTGRIAFVTGSTRGIGAAIALGLKEAGATVWIHGSREETAKEAAGKYGFRWVSGDFGNTEELKRVAKEIKNREDHLDILVNNAGCEAHEPVGQISQEVWDKIHRVNGKAPLLLLQELLPLLEKSSHPSVINVSSIHQLIPMRTGAAYCMSKAELAMFTKVAALELAGRSIRVNNLAPGAIATDINREVVEALPFQDWIPLGRVGSPQELVGPAVFLASDASSYMTGATLFVDGGYKENLLRY